MSVHRENLLSVDTRRLVPGRCPGAVTKLERSVHFGRLFLE